MKSFGAIVVALTLLLSAVATWIYLHRDRSSQVPNRPSSPSPVSLPPSPLSSSPVHPVPVSRPFVPSPKEQVSSAMDEVIVKSLISQARTASIKGDAATTSALVKGLKNHRATSEKLLAAEIAAANDPECKRHLENILVAVSGEMK